MAVVTSVEVWKALAELADLWHRAPVVQQVAKELPSVTPPVDGIPRYVQTLYAGASFVLEQPLAVSDRVRWAERLPGPPEDNPDPEALQVWLEAGDRLRIAHLETVNWVRSRLPGYPMVGAPQLARGTSVTTEEWGYRMPWLPNAFAEGHQQRDAPRPIGQLLGDPAGNLALVHATVNLATALANTDEWQTFCNTRAALTPADREVLKQARAELTALFKPEAIDAYEPRYAMPREQYRRHHTSTVVESLEGLAGKFARAFAAVDRLIDEAAVDTLAQLAMYGRPRRLYVSELDIRGGEAPWLTFNVDDADFPWPTFGNLFRLDDPLVSDAVAVQGESFSSFDQRARLRIHARVLTGTGDAWTPA